MIKSYQQCNYCIMDNKSDDTIFFDENGQCNYCISALKIKNQVYFPNDKGVKKLNNLIKRLKEENKNHNYDCIMGISGGLDSSYLAYLGSVKWGLRILAVHVDDGFNTEISERNIARISKLPNLKLTVIKPDPKQFNDLTKAYMRAGVPNLAVPQDNVLFACVYEFLKENKLRTFLSGTNYALECILQRGNTHSAYDLANIKAINKKFGHGSISKLSFISMYQKMIDSFIHNIETVTPLNYIDYNRNKAMLELEEYCGFEYYGSKHLENDLTRFIQQYWFYNKFGVDKRTSHFSSMIVSGQMSREEAQKQYSMPLYDQKEMELLIEKILIKLDMTYLEFEHIMSEKGMQHGDYPVSAYYKFPALLRLIKKIFKNNL